MPELDVLAQKDEITKRRCEASAGLTEAQEAQKNDQSQAFASLVASRQRGEV
jgi:hypothetical protein